MASASAVIVGSLALAAGATGAPSQKASLLQTWSKQLDGTATPVTRVVNLLKEMQGTLQKDMDDDEALYNKLACWCNNGQYEKGEFVEATTSKIAELQSSIESLTARSAELKTQVEELNTEAANDKAALAEATELRQKQQQEFHGSELDSIQAVENLKAALEVLAKHHGANADTPWMQSPAGSLLEVNGKVSPWMEAHEARSMNNALDDFMRHSGMADSGVENVPAAPAMRGTQQFIQSRGADAMSGAAAANAGDASSSWSAEDSAIVRNALRSASRFAAKRGEKFMPSYHAQSGEIVGVMKQLKEEMEADLSSDQKTEQSRAAAFAELRAAKTQEIENGEAMAEKKEDEKATTDNELAEAKEDLEQETASLTEAQAFLANMKTTCAEASKNFDARKVARVEEIKAVSETIEILTEDSGRDAMTGTYSFLQTVAGQLHKNQREAAAALLRKSGSPELSALATSVELDAFTKVKKAIDDMVAMLKQQQADEVKKTDWCKAEIQENEMISAKTETRKADLEASIAELAEAIKGLEKGIQSAHAEIAQIQTDLQRASEDRVKENIEFQKTVADQTVTIEVLKKALDRLATYYDQAGLLQTRGSQAPPVAQMEYKPNSGSTGAMQMIEKLVYEAKGLVASSKKAESEAQSAYEALVAETNASVKALQEEVTSKSKAKAQAAKTKLSKEGDVADTVTELEGLYKYNADLHSDCDYVLKNFESRQAKRRDEIEALQQAKQILSGASLS